MPKRKEEEVPRKTGVQVIDIPSIVKWLVDNCSATEIEFMTSLASDPRRFRVLNSIFTKLTEYNKHEVFMYKYRGPEDLMVFHASKRGSVAGLKAFAMACQVAYRETSKREEELSEEGR